MIISLLYLIASAFLQAAAALFGALNYAPPIAQLFSGVSYFLSYTSIFSGVIDLPAAYGAAGIAIGFEIFWVLFLIGWYIIGFSEDYFQWVVRMVIKNIFIRGIV